MSERDKTCAERIASELDDRIRTEAAQVIRDLYQLAEQYNRTNSSDDRDNLRGAILSVDPEDDGDESLLLAYGGPTEWVHLHQDGTGSYHYTYAPDGRWQERTCALTPTQVRDAAKVATLYRIAERDAEQIGV